METKLDSNQPHSPTQAAYLGKACELAYLPADSGSAAFREQLQLEAQLISVDNTQVYVGENDQNIVVVFRGSESFLNLDGFKDWLLTNARNFLILPEGRIGSDFAAAGVGARFHSGFMGALDEIWQPLFAAVDGLFARQERPVWVTGHSLGGALALLCGWRFHQHFIAVHQICTFGAPMIGNDAAAAAFEREFPGKIYRYVDAGDLVPKLPTISLFSNSYMHCQREVVVGGQTSDSVWQSLSSAAGDAAADAGGLSASLIQSIWSELSKGMPSHMMGNYLGRITKR